MAMSEREKRIIELIVKTTGEGDLKRMAAELRATRRAADETQKGLGSISGALQSAGKWAGGFVAALGVQQVIQWGRAILDAADALDAAAEQAGIGVERYQTLKEAFRSLEVDGRKFESGVERLATALSDTLAGDTTTATEALDRLGIKTKILSGEVATTDELIDALANSQKALSSDVTFTSDVVDIFGRKLGVDYANALKGGKLATAEMQAAMAEFGYVTEEEMAVLAEASETVEQFQTRAGNAILTWSATAITAFEDARGAVERWIDKVREGQSLAGAAVDIQRENLVREWQAGRQSAIDAATGGEAALRRTLRGLPGSVPVIPRSARGGARRRGGGGKSEADREADRVAEAENKKVEDALKRKLDAERDAIATAEHLTAELREQAAALNEAADPALAYANALAKLNEVAATGALTDRARREELERIAQAMLDASAAAEGWEEAGDAANKKLEQQREAAAKAREQWEFIGYAVGQATYDVITGTEKIGAAVKQMVAAILAEVARLAAVKIAAKVVTALFPGTTPAAKGAAFAGGVKAFAKGGILTAPTMFGLSSGIGIAGEAGPEVVAPLRRDKAGNLGVGAVSPRVTVNNYAGAEVAVTPTPEGVQIDIVRRALADDIRRGGNPVSAAIEGVYRVGRQAAAFG